MAGRDEDKLGALVILRRKVKVRLARVVCRRPMLVRERGEVGVRMGVKAAVG